MLHSEFLGLHSGPSESLFSLDFFFLCLFLPVVIGSICHLPFLPSFSPDGHGQCKSLSLSTKAVMTSKANFALGRGIRQRSVSMPDPQDQKGQNTQPQYFNNKVISPLAPASFRRNMGHISLSCWGIRNGRQISKMPQILLSNFSQPFLHQEG